MKIHPPKWADRFLEWYCNPLLLDEIQGDAYEIYYRAVKENKTKADLHFIWNVIRFFRWKNIKKRNKKNNNHPIPFTMIKNILLVTLRNFLRQPGHSLLNVFGLTIGFTCVLLILSWVTHESSFDQLHKEGNRIFKVITHVASDKSVQTHDAAAANIDVSSVPEVEELVSVSTDERWPNVLCLKGSPDKECVYINGVYANKNFFSTFDFTILEGDQDPLSKPNQIAISENMAYKFFNTESPIGKTLKVDGWHNVLIVSIFKNVPVNSSLQFDFVMPFNVVQKLWGAKDEDMANNFFTTYVKTNSNITAKALTEKLNDVRVITEEYKAQKISYQAIPLLDWHLNSQFENGVQAGGRMKYIIIFSIIGLLVIIMAVINFINLATAKASQRAKEIGIRKVTGAYRSSLIFQFTGEAFVFVLISFVLALLATQLSLPAFSSLLGEQMNVNLIQGWTPFIILGFLIIVSLLAGLYPAFILSSFQPVSVLKSQVAPSGSGSLLLRKFLLTLQLTVSIGIIIFSSVLYLQLKFVTKKDLGYDRSNMIRVEPTAKLFKKFDAFKEELAKYSSIISVGACNMNPLHTNGSSTGVEWPGKPKDMRVAFKVMGCSYEFPKTLGLKILEGRDLLPKPQDSIHHEILVTQDGVKTMGLTNPVGELIKIGDAECVIVGVVNNFHTESLHSARIPAILYQVNYMNTSGVYVRYQPGTTRESLAGLEAIYKKFEPDFPIKYWFQDETFDETYKQEIVASRLILLFTSIALVISVLGIIGLATYNILRKSKEIGVRRVFGATVSQVMTLLFKEFSWIIAIAAVIAFPIVWITTSQWLTGFAYRIEMPWWIYITTFVGIVTIIITIICLQGLKTVTTNAIKTLRSE